MAKFCGKCGAALDGDERVCGKCGTPIPGAKPIPGIKTPKDIQRAKKRKKIIAIIVAVAIVAVAAIIAINIVSKFTGSNGLVRQVMSAYRAYDIDKLVSLSSDVYYYGENNQAEEYFETTVGETLDYFEDSVGHSYQLSYDVNEIYTLSDRKKDVLMDDLEYIYSDFDLDTIKKVKVANVTLTAKQGDRISSRDVELTMTKEDKDWKLLYINYMW